MRQEHVDLRLARCHGLEQRRQASVCVGTCHQVHRLQKLVLEPLGHAAENAYDDALALSLLQLELVDPSPDPLLRIISDRACVGEYDIRLFYVFSQDVSRILQD